MKNLTNALQKGNLKPRERVLLMVHDAVKKEQTGKGILTEAELHALVGDGWQPANNEQVREYNRYHKAWRTAGFAELDAQAVFLSMMSEYYREGEITFQLVSYPLFKIGKRHAEDLKHVLPVSADRAIEIIKKQREVKLKDGLDFDYAVYQLAYENLDAELREDILALDQEAEYEPSYLTDEETLANLLNGKDELTQANKETLANLIAKRCYNDHAKEWQFHHSYASIPMKALAQRWIDKRKVKPTLRDDERFRNIFEKAREATSQVRGSELSQEEAEKEIIAENVGEIITRYAKDHKTTVEAELKEVLLEWLNNGLLEEYAPLCISNTHETHDKPTKLPHNEVYKRWIEAKTKARETLEKLIKEGKLERGGDKLTGESLYAFKGDLRFIKEHNEYVDRYDTTIGCVYADDDPEHKGRHLDRELLITDIDKDGKPARLMGFQFALDGLTSYFKNNGFIAEKDVNGGRVIDFLEEADHFKKVLNDTTEHMRLSYSELLAFKELFDRLSKVFEIDLSYKVNDWIKRAEYYIDRHNFRLKEATAPDLKTVLYKDPLKLKGDWIIDTKKLQPDKTRANGYFEEFENLLGGEF